MYFFSGVEGTELTEEDVENTLEEEQAPCTH